MAVDQNSIILGSGRVFVSEFDRTETETLPDGTVTEKFPTDEIIETAENTLGRISGGAELVYEPEEYAVEDDDGDVVMRFITSENVTFRAGVLTWALENLEKLSQGRLDIDVDGGKELRIGGASSLKTWLVRFVHTLPDKRKLRITLLGTAGSGFTLAFAGDAETTYDAEFGAISQGDKTLVSVREEPKL